MTYSQAAFASSLQFPVLNRSRLPQTCRQRPRISNRTQPVAVQKPEMPEAAKKAARAGENVAYWQGEWICVDCGFVYKPTRRVRFEDLPGTWKCPQCNAPKRRFAKKAGDYIAETAGTSNLPIIVFSIVGLLATIAFGVWASKNL